MGLSKSNNIELSCRITNVGRDDRWTASTDEVVFVFATWNVSSASDFSGRVPVRQLVAFARLRQIAAKESRVWTATVPAKHYALVSSTGDRVLPSGLVTFFVGGH